MEYQDCTQIRDDNVLNRRKIKLLSFINRSHSLQKQTKFIFSSIENIIIPYSRILLL